MIDISRGLKLWLTGPNPLPTDTSAPARMASETYILASLTASSMLRPRAIYAAMAAESVHPVPCVFCVAMVSDENVWDNMPFGDAV